jgi:hypothetical protein
VNTSQPCCEPWSEATVIDKPILSPYAIMDERALGFLRLTAASVTLNIEVLGPDDMAADHTENCCVCKYWPSCRIRTCTGKNVGLISVPRSWLEGRSHKQGEIILLSKYIEHAENETCPEIWVWDSPSSKTSMGVGILMIVSISRSIMSCLLTGRKGRIVLWRLGLVLHRWGKRTG